MDFSPRILALKARARLTSPTEVALLATQVHTHTEYSVQPCCILMETWYILAVTSLTWVPQEVVPSDKCLSLECWVASLTQNKCRIHGNTAASCGDSCYTLGRAQKVMKLTYGWLESPRFLPGGSMALLVLFVTSHNGNAEARQEVPGVWWHLVASLWRPLICRCHLVWDVVLKRKLQAGTLKLSVYLVDQPGTTVGCAFWFTNCQCQSFYQVYLVSGCTSRLKL